ncbi:MULTISPECIES: hypothetical protein [unclassified Streptomyces]
MIGMVIVSSTEAGTPFGQGRTPEEATTSSPLLALFTGFYTLESV